MAQSPSPEPPPWFGGRVEMPEYGVAVTFPEDWLAFDLTGDVAGQVRAVPDVIGDLFPRGATDTSADFQRRGERYELLGLSLHGQACELGVVWNGGADVLDPALHQRLDAAIRAEPGFEGFDGVAPVDLPGGPAITFQWVQAEGDPKGQDLPHATYMIGGPDRGVTLTCEGSSDLPTTGAPSHRRSRSCRQSIRPAWLTLRRHGSGAAWRCRTGTSRSTCPRAG